MIRKAEIRVCTVKFCEATDLAAQESQMVALFEEISLGFVLCYCALQMVTEVRQYHQCSAEILMTS